LEASLPVVQVHQLRVRRIVADDDVQRTITVHVSETARVRAIRSGAEVVRGSNASAAITKEHAIDERPVTSLGEHDVEMTIAIKVAETDVGRRLGRGLQQQHALVHEQLRRRRPVEQDVDRGQRDGEGQGRLHAAASMRWSQQVAGAFMAASPKRGRPTTSERDNEPLAQK
jgi:hypothetical protein